MALVAISKQKAIEEAKRDRRFDSLRALDDSSTTPVNPSSSYPWKMI